MQCFLVWWCGTKFLLLGLWDRKASPCHWPLCWQRSDLRRPDGSLRFFVLWESSSFPVYEKDYAPLCITGCLCSLPHYVWHVILSRLWCFCVLSLRSALWTGDVVLRSCSVRTKKVSPPPTTVWLARAWPPTVWRAFSSFQFGEGVFCPI
jgi:hypothetical protein